MSWRLPHDFSIDTSRDVLVGTAHNFYKKRCRTLRVNWESEDSADWLPHGMAECTPYSLLLLAKLAKLSKRTKGQKQRAHAALLRYRTERLNFITNDFVVSTRGKGPPFESVIEERTDGIMVVDIMEATELIEKERALSKAKEQEARQGARMNISQDATVLKVIQRRQQKLQWDVELQRELWKAQGAGGVELVGMEYSNGESSSGNVDDDKDKKSLWNELREQARQSNKKSVRKLKSRTSRDRKSRPSRMSHVLARIEEESVSWDDTDSEQDEEISDLEATTVTRPTKKAAKPVNALAISVQKHTNFQSMDETAKALRKRDRQKRKLRTQIVNDTLERAKERSVRLPSERMDFAALGKLQSKEEYEDMTSMTNALSDVLQEVAEE